MVCQVADGDAGTGIFLADDNGRPKGGAGLLETRNNRGKKDPKELVWGFALPTDRQTEARIDRQRPPPYAGNEQWVRIVAGGNMTIRPGLSGKPYDYVRADEFGTVKMPARPFFFPTYRLRKKKMIADMKRRLTASIKQRSAE